MALMIPCAACNPAKATKKLKDYADFLLERKERFFAFSQAVVLEKSGVDIALAPYIPSHINEREKK